ncbi:MAG: MBL fold metallo-hydrolase [Sphingomonas sp.]|nr:MBL fold metallo-hydrolase [Sphingomonas sp.]
MKVRILGCGTSTGVPKIGNDWGQCDPSEPRNRRLRSSILVETGGARILVDCGPDLRAQLLAADVSHIDGLIVTHDHGDHVHGIDDLRPLSANLGGPVPVYARAATLKAVEQRFAYAFAQSDFYRPIAQARPIEDELAMAGATARFVDQPHGSISTLGMRFDEEEKSVAYAIDFNAFTDDMATLYEGADIWIADCLTRSPHPTHAHLDAVLGWARDCKVGQLYLTHMGNGLDYATLVSELPDWAAPAHDGLEIAL